MRGRRLLGLRLSSSLGGWRLLCITWAAAVLLLSAHCFELRPMQDSESSSSTLDPPLPYSYLQLSSAAAAHATAGGDGDSAAAAKEVEAKDSKKEGSLDPAARQQETDRDISDTPLSSPEADGHDVLLDLLGEEPEETDVLGVPLEELHADLDPVVLKLEEHIFSKAKKTPEKGGPSAPSDLMEASLDLGRLARGLDLGDKAADVDNADLHLLESLPAEEVPEALRGLITLEGQELLGGHLVRLWGAHRRLGLSLHEAMAAFVASIEREKARDAAVAAVMDVYKARLGVEAAQQEKQKVAEAGAELQMLRQQHKYLGKQRRLLRRSLKQAATDPSNLSTQIEDMWAPVDASAALDPARGSNFYHAVKLLGEDAQRTASTCAKLLLLVGHVTKEEGAATKQQLEKEASEEEELRLVVNPETGPLAALSSPSLSTLSLKNPKALREADEEFMRQEGDAAGLPRLQQQQPYVLLPSGLSQQQRAASLGIPPRRARLNRAGSGDGLDEDDMPLGPTEIFFRLPLSPPQRQQQDASLQLSTVSPSVVYDEEPEGGEAAAAGDGDVSFLELQAGVDELAPSSVSQDQQPHHQQNTPRLKAVAPHDAASYSPESSFLTLKDTSEKEDEEEEEEEEAAASAQESASEKASHSTQKEGDEADKRKQHKESKEEQQDEEQDKEAEGSAAASGSSHEEGPAAAASAGEEAGESTRAASSTAAAAAAEATAHEAPSVSMLRDLGEGSCESITDPAACMQKENCFQDFIYGACFFNCTTVETPEDCEKHTFCRYEKHVPHNACVNEGYQTTDAVVQKFEGILRGCEHFTKKETCDWMYQHGQRLVEAEKQQQQQKETAAGDKISATAHLGPSPYHCQWMSGASEKAGGEGSKKEGAHEDLGGSSVCGNLKDAPTAERLLWGTVVAEKEKKLRELKATEHVEQEDVCVRPSDRLAVLQPNRPFYSVGSVVKFSCLPGSVLLGVSDEIECKADGTFVPALSCVEESDLSPTQLQHLRRKTAALTASAGASPFSWTLPIAAGLCGLLFCMY
ncbi:hypothetical protein Emed_006415 [Eimeria media]